MGFFDFIKKKDAVPLDPLKDLILEKMRIGYFVDYDMQTWQVIGYNSYEYGEGESVDEWELKHGREKRYLERFEEDEVIWSFGQKIAIGAIEGDLRKYIMKNDDLPENITYNGLSYYLDESGAGYFYKNGTRPGIQFIFWNFIDEANDKYVSIEQWGESDFEASAGIFVEEYQFTNILPGE